MTPASYLVTGTPLCLSPFRQCQLQQNWACLCHPSPPLPPAPTGKEQPFLFDCSPAVIRGCIPGISCLGHSQHHPPWLVP